MGVGSSTCASLSGESRVKDHIMKWSVNCLGQDYVSPFKDLGFSKRGSDVDKRISNKV